MERIALKRGKNFVRRKWTCELKERVGGFAKFVYGNDCSGFPAGGKGVRRPGPVEDREDVVELKGRDA